MANHILIADIITPELDVWERAVIGTMEIPFL